MTTTFTATILPEKMGGGDPVPIEIGARGTVGNLVMKEIEYFQRLEAVSHVGGGDHCKCSIKSSSNTNKKHGGGGSNFWPSFGFLNISWRKSKRKGGGSGRFLPRMCTMVDIADSRHHNHHRLNKIPSFSYRNLKDDVSQFDV
ncbi:hypothetical protein L2E82_40239 [Cichorium intybus]|uniref:Uncharacterized protein n=1 Tax=Cichorium intybus TaxID=13427 RepID=A0ACB9ALS9_CICIN|nr:hypothetical protein L2E82_40239 [Cichorium intybus]